MCSGKELLIIWHGLGTAGDTMTGTISFNLQKFSELLGVNDLIIEMKKLSPRKM